MTMAPDELDNRLVLNHEYGQHGFPFEEWRWLRANQPVKMIDATNVQPFWAITKHRHITEISAQPDVFSSAAGNIILFRRDQMEAVADESNPFNQMRVIISMDPPDHRTFRKVASGFFTPRGITRLDEIVTDTATLMMNRLAEHGDQPVDFVEHVAQRHPLRVLCTILGVPEEDEDRLLELTSQLFAFDDPDVGRPAKIGRLPPQSWAWSSSPCSTRSSRTAEPTPATTSPRCSPTPPSRTVSRWGSSRRSGTT